MNGSFEYLDLEDLVDLALKMLSDPPPIRDFGLLGSAAARPSSTAFGHDAYPNLVTKAATLLQSIVNNHALIDGNKRLGWLATAVFLELNGQTTEAISNDDVFDLVIWVASKTPEIEAVTNRLEELLGD